MSDMRKWLVVVASGPQRDGARSRTEVATMVPSFSKPSRWLRPTAFAAGLIGDFVGSQRVAQFAFQIDACGDHVDQRLRRLAAAERPLGQAADRGR